eukprot:Anaeramoba_ignava/a347366_8.p2 GENE.a347366_8~~a347366_8.p2  ORF type:complete len:127 (+),score=23.69 a347366_8:970-1350(+)
MLRNRKKVDRTSIVCPKSKRHESLFVCAINCHKKCPKYIETITIGLLLEFVNQHPEYKIVGEMMAAPKAKKTAEEKKYWVVTEENHFVELTEKEILENPLDYIGKQVFDRPPAQYEIVVALKKIKK